MPDWSRIGRLLDFCAAYYTTQIVRCAAFSFLLLGLVMLARKMLFSRRTFLRGLLWPSFLLISQKRQVTDRQSPTFEKNAE